MSGSYVSDTTPSIANLCPPPTLSLLLQNFKSTTLNIEPPNFRPIHDSGVLNVDPPIDDLDDTFLQALGVIHHHTYVLFDADMTGNLGQPFTPLVNGEAVLSLDGLKR